MQTRRGSIRGIHHTAFRCRDAAQTREFYEGILGLPLAAALAFDTEPGTQTPLHYMHLFFELGDGNYIAFFDLPESSDESKFKRKSGFNLHVAFEVPNRSDLGDYLERFKIHEIEHHGPIDHHFVHSIYAWDPNGIQVEITWRDPRHDVILTEERGKSSAAMTHWEGHTAPIRAARAQAAAQAQNRS
ncbi:MAG: VOC family protein [Betaproteobacteria bacterium]|jgi:catechol 2,3-dioxygenase-like lactoylglutathione lyase family enzyme